MAKDTEYQETRYGRPHELDSVSYTGWNIKEPDPRGRYALSCIERWGMVAGVPDGEDTSGRSKLRLATPDELVDRAAAITAKMFTRLDELGWMVERLSVEGANNLIKDKENGKERRN